jgi:hypothetical protein
MGLAYMQTMLVHNPLHPTKLLLNKSLGNEANPREIFGDNLPRLQNLKIKYDPGNVFRKWHDLFLRR